MSKGLQIGIATLTIFAGVAWLLHASSGGEGTFRYYTSVSDYVNAGEVETVSGRGSRVHGFVLDGSILRDLPARHVDFVIADERGSKLPVRLMGVEVPDLFRGGAEVVVEGRRVGNRFVAVRVLAKCPSKYEEADGPSGSEA